MRMLRLKTILAATDLSESSDAALESAARLATAAGATLHVVFVPPSSEQPRSGTDRTTAEAELPRVLKRAGATVGQSHIHIVPGDPKTTIGPLASALGADVIVLGRHAAASTRDDDRPVGGTAHAVIISATVPCLVISRPLTFPLGRVVVGVDESETSRGALIVAISWASALRSRAPKATSLTAVHVHLANEVSSVRTTLDEDLAALRRVGGDWAGVSVSARTLEAENPVTAIADFANELKPDLVVLGTRALGRPTHPVLGSVAAAVTKRLALPVLLVPPAIWREYSRDIAIDVGSQGIADEESALR
jgi:universal stress protein E